MMLNVTTIRGSFVMERYEEAGAEPAPAEQEEKGFLLRLFESIVRFFLRLFGSRISISPEPSKRMRRGYDSGGERVHRVQ